MAYVIGIDVSTTATKAVVIDEAGEVVAVGVVEYGYEVPHPLWSEQDPGLWWDGAVSGDPRRAGRRPASMATAVVGVGLTGQMHGLVLLDAAGDVLRPAILWNDQRTAAACDEIRAAVGPERLIAITGNDALPGFTAPKLVWVRDHEPDIWARIAHVLLPKDYVRLRLTGEYALDKADGAGTILFDLAARDWSPEVVAALGIDPAWLPPTFEGPVVTGVVSAAAADGDRDCVPASRSWPAAATSPPTRSGSGPCGRASWRCRWGPRASSSPRPTRRCATRGARSTRSVTPSPIGGT